MTTVATQTTEDKPMPKTRTGHKTAVAALQAALSHLPTSVQGPCDPADAAYARDCIVDALDASATGGDRLTLYEWIKAQEAAYRSMPHRAGEIIADHLHSLTTEVELLGFPTIPDAYWDRKAAWYGDPAAKAKVGAKSD